MEKDFDFLILRKIRGFFFLKLNRKGYNILIIFEKIYKNIKIFGY